MMKTKNDIRRSRDNQQVEFAMSLKGPTVTFEKLAPLLFEGRRDAWRRRTKQDVLRALYVLGLAWWLMHLPELIARATS